MDYSAIGKQLKLIREKKGLSYDQIYEMTKIQPSILQGIEEGKPLVSHVFLKNFIKTYANLLGVDSDTFFHRFQKNTMEKENVKRQKTDRKVKKKNKISIPYVSLAVFIFIVLCFGIFQLSKKSLKGYSNINSLGQNKDLEKKHSDVLEESFSNGSQNVKKGGELTKGKASLFEEVKYSVFKKEILIQSSEALDIYFKMDKNKLITKRLEPYKWFSIKARDNLYLRFDLISNDVSIFYNGKQLDLSVYKGWFERNF